jgi:predicted Zn finger-like uncharacterized protein
MRLSCPNCLSEYDVPDAALAKPARQLRCGQCGHQWQNAWPEAAGAVVTVPVEVPVAVDEAVAMDVVPAQAERLFGKPVDEEAQAEMRRAAAAELQVPPEPNPAPNMVEGLPLSGTFPELADGAPNGFTDLMYAARKRSVAGETVDEPEAELPVVQAQKSRTPVVVLLVILVLVAVVFAAHGWLMKHVPASVGFFHALGFKA